MAGRALGSVASTWAVLLLCVNKDMLLGTVLGVAGFQIAGYVEQLKQRRQAEK